MANMTKTQRFQHLMKMIQDRAKLDTRIQGALGSMDQLIPGFRLVQDQNANLGAPTGPRKGFSRSPLTLAGFPRKKPGPKPGTPRKQVRVKGKGKKTGSAKAKNMVKEEVK